MFLVAGAAGQHCSELFPAEELCARALTNTGGAWRTTAAKINETDTFGERDLEDDVTFDDVDEDEAIGAEDEERGGRHYG